MERSERKGILRNHTVRSFAGKALILGSALTFSYAAYDGVNTIRTSAVTQSVGKDLDDKGVSPPPSWNEAYRWAEGQRYSNEIRKAVDVAGVGVSVMGMGVGFGILPTKKRRI